MELLGTESYRISSGNVKGLTWAWAHKVVGSKDKFKIFIGHSSCRESATDFLRNDDPRFYSYMNGQKAEARPYLVVSQNRPVVIKNSRFAVNEKEAPIYEENFINWMRRSVKLLNAYEKELGWPLSKMGFPKHKAEGHVFAIFNSTKRWLKSPTSSSLYTLLIRISCKPYSPRLRKAKTIVKHILDSKEKFVNRADQTHTMKTYVWGMEFLKNLDKIYEGRNLKKVWEQEGFSYGISHFLSGSASGSQTTKFGAICKKKGLPEFRKGVGYSRLCELIGSM